MKIAQVVCTDNFAGAERYVATLSQQLASQGEQVTVIGGGHDRMAADCGPQVRWLPGATIPAAVAALRKAGPFDVIHVHMTKAELAGVIAAPLLRAPLVATNHFAQPRGASPAGRLASALINRRLSTQLAISDFVHDRVSGESTVVRPGVAIVPDPLPNAAQREKVVLVAQRLELEKRTDLALAVWHASGLAEQGWRLRIAGGGALEGELRAQASELGIQGSVDFLGPVKEIGEQFAAASILLAPRDDEPYGLTVVEAMAAGLPVVAGRGGGHDETVGAAPDGVLYEATSVAAGGQALIALAADAQRRDAYGQQLAQVQREKLTIARQAGDTLAVYRQVTGARR